MKNSHDNDVHQQSRFHFHPTVSISTILSRVSDPLFLQIPPVLWPVSRRLCLSPGSRLSWQKQERYVTSIARTIHSHMIICIYIYDSGIIELESQSYRIYIYIYYIHIIQYNQIQLESYRSYRLNYIGCSCRSLTEHRPSPTSAEGFPPGSFKKKHR